LSRSKSEKDELATNLANFTVDISRLKTEKEKAFAKNRDLKSELEALTIKYNITEAEQKEGKSKLEGDNQKLKGTITKLEAEAHSSNVQIAEFMEQVLALTEERDVLAAELGKAAEDISKLHASVLSARNKSDEEKLVIHSEKEALAAKVRGSITQLDVERAEAQSKIDGLQTNISELQVRNKSLMSDLNTSKTETNELVSQIEKLEANYKALESEMEESINHLQDEMSTSVGNLQNSLAEKSRVIRQLNEQLNNQFTLSTSNHEADSNVIDSLKKEIVELKSLLSSSNASVEEARSAALYADQELEEKELQLENALRNLAEHEEAQHIAEDKLRKLSPRSSSARTDSEEELLRDMEVLMGEKIDAESRLELELNRRKDIEDEIKKAAEEEKQLLIDEAESKMNSLRDEISQLKSDLSRVESDCYNMKDENADLHDKIKKVEAKLIDSEDIATSMREELNREQNERAQLQEKLHKLEEESAAFKSQVFAAKNAFEVTAQSKLADVEAQLNDALSWLAKSRNDAKLSKEMIAELSSDIEQYRTELESVKGIASNSNEIELSKLREELAQIKLDFSQEKANTVSVKRDLESAKEKIDRIKRHEHEKQQKLASKAKEAIETLKNRLAKAESEVGNIAGRAEIERLQKEVKELKCTLGEKDERIKKLEKSKITKSQIANIQKLKDERIQFMAEAEEYKKQVEELESRKMENSRPRRSGLRERKDAAHHRDQSKEVNKLQDELRQCNSKLRKYVEHSERLEKDRRSVIEAISSCDVGDIVGDGMMEMVVSLCDKLASIEEECNVLASSHEKAAGKATEYLAQLDSLREKYAELEKQVKIKDENDTKLATTLAECKTNLKKAEEKIAALAAEKETLAAAAANVKGNVSGLQSEHSRQLHHLSNENLQLGDELKRTKKELTQAKAELDAIQKNAFSSEQTVELEGLSNLLGSSASAKRAPSESAIKTGRKRIPLGSSKKRCQESPSRKEDIKDKENLLNKKQRTLSSPFSSATKKKKNTNPFSSVKKAARRSKRALTDDSPTKQYVLGDNEPTADVTGECNQS